MNEDSYEEEQVEIPLCGALKRDGSGETCSNVAGKNTDHLYFGKCSFHGGCSPSGKKNAERLMVLAEIEKYEGPTTDDPQEALINEIKRTGAAVAWLDLVVKDLDPDHEYVKKHERERLHLARAAKMALDAGIDERRVKIAEIQMRQVAEIMRRIFGDDRLQLTEQQRQLVPMVVREHLRLVA